MATSVTTSPAKFGGGGKDTCPLESTFPAKFGGGGRDTCPLESTSPAKFGGGGSDTCALVLLLLLLYYCYNYHNCYASHLYTSSYLSFPEPQVTERISLLLYLGIKYLTTSGPGVAGVPLDAVAVWLVAARVARHAEGVGAARVPHARVQA